VKGVPPHYTAFRVLLAVVVVVALAVLVMVVAAEPVRMVVEELLGLRR
jgi:hypothetical protein